MFELSSVSDPDKLQFLIKKIFNFFQAVYFSQFFVIKALYPDWIRVWIGIRPQMLDPDPDQMNTDPKPWSFQLKDIFVFPSNLFILQCPFLSN